MNLFLTTVVFITLWGCKLNSPSSSGLKESSEGPYFSCEQEKEFSEFWKIRYKLVISEKDSEELSLSIVGIPTDKNTQTREEVEWCAGCRLLQDKDLKKGDLIMRGETNSGNVLRAHQEGDELVFQHFEDSAATKVVNTVNCPLPPDMGGFSEVEPDIED